MKTCVALSVVLVSSAFALGCSSPDGSDPGAQSDDTTATTYVGIHDFNNSVYDGAFYDIQSKLAGEFGQVCGDTFCGGDYSNLTPLTLNCSVSSKAGTVHDCVWTFAGSLEIVNPDTSAIQISAPTYQCHFKPSSHTTAATLVSFFQGSSDLHDPLPGTTASVYDAIGECFQHPIGTSPVTVIDEAHPKYVEASDFYTSAAGQAKVATLKANLKQGFDNVCGDTFCGGDYGDLQSMAFVCSVTESTGNLKSCDWVFGGSLVFPQANGTWQLDSKSWTCPVAVKGTLSQLAATVNAPVTPTNPSQPIDRPLPGVSTSAYDSLLNCLP